MSTDYILFSVSTETCDADVYAPSHAEAAIEYLRYHNGFAHWGDGVKPATAINSKTMSVTPLNHGGDLLDDQTQDFEANGLIDA